MLLLCFWKKSFKNRKKSTSHTNTNYASICNCWVNLLTILIFYSYYDLIDKVLPYFWSVIINNYIYFNLGQNSPRFFLSSTSFSIHLSKSTSKKWLPVAISISYNIRIGHLQIDQGIWNISNSFRPSWKYQWNHSWLSKISTCGWWNTHRLPIVI